MTIPAKQKNSNIRILGSVFTDVMDRFAKIKNKPLKLEKQCHKVL
jgi:hypothetical protein